MIIETAHVTFKALLHFIWLGLHLYHVGRTDEIGEEGGMSF